MPVTSDHQQLLSGKRITRKFDADGQLVSERHGYGLIDISIETHFNAGVKTAEIYIVNRRIASRKQYNRAREAYKDMPLSDASIDDFGDRLLIGARAERRQWSKAAKAHVQDPKSAARQDAFCRSLLKRGKKTKAETWIKSKTHTLGELTHAKSRNLIDRLFERGAKRVYLCDIDAYDNGAENTGHLVIELPDDSSRRRLLFREVKRMASPQGFRGELDNGQCYLYVALD
jgi:hypothetical protein